MPIYEYTSQFAGLPVVDWEPGKGIRYPTGTLHRVSLSYADVDAGRRWTDRFAQFLDEPAVDRIPGIVVGFWDPGLGGDGDSHPVIEALVAARNRLPELKAIFLGDITSDECEISWIRQSDVSPLLEAYPALEHFCVRGSEDLSLGTLRHAQLKSLIVQSGGLPARVVREVAEAQLPELEHLELWLGTEEYGGDATVEDLAPILSGHLFPKLSTLGLRDSEIADEIAAAVAITPVIRRIRVLDLSLGTLSNHGAAALLGGLQALLQPSLPGMDGAPHRLEKLDIHHHYCSEEMVEKLKALCPIVEAGDRQDMKDQDNDDRYVAVGE